MELVIKEGMSPKFMPIPIITEIDPDDLDMSGDIDKIVTAFKEAGYEISFMTAYRAHCIHDEDYCASWLSLPDDKDIVKTYLPYLIRKGAGRVGYATVGDKPSIVIRDADSDGFMETSRKIWYFIYTHRNHVLRDFYQECTAAKVTLHDMPTDPVLLDDGTYVIPILCFRSDWATHKPYIEIIQRELKIAIDGLPQ